MAVMSITDMLQNYTFSILSQSYSLIIELGVSSYGHIREVLDGLNATDKRLIYHLMSTVQIPGSE